MTLPQIKEKISKGFIELIAAYNNVKAITPFEDHGVDLIIKPVKHYYFNGQKRYVDGGEIIGIQIKSTSEKQISETDSHIKYDLNAKNYNDLIWRQ